MSDVYRTIARTSEGLYKDKGSKFISFAYPIDSEELAKKTIVQLKKQFHDARHHCFAYAIGPEREINRSSDDGEPSGTAGKPIYNQILSYQLTNILIVVVRYFGGTLLGTSGLINAYKMATIDAINNNQIIEKTVEKKFMVEFDYSILPTVKRLIHELQININNQNYGGKCIFSLSVRQSKFEETLSKFEALQLYNNIKVIKD